jgi:hypothetical protein
VAVVVSRASHLATCRWVAAEWPEDFIRLAPDVRILVRFAYDEHEKVWETDDVLRAEIRQVFVESPRFVEECAEYG